MDLNLIEKFILIALSDEEGKFVTDSTYLRNGIAGSILCELFLKRRIEIVGKEIHVINESDVDDELLNQALKGIVRGEGNDSLAYWMKTFYLNANDVKRDVLRKLVSQGVLKEVKGQFLWVFKYYRYPTHDPVPEDKVRRRLHDILDELTEPDEEDVILLNLIDACALNAEAFALLEDQQKAKHVRNQYGSMISEENKAVIQATLRATIEATSPD